MEKIIVKNIKLYVLITIISIIILIILVIPSGMTSHYNGNTTTLEIDKLDTEIKSICGIHYDVTPSIDVIEDKTEYKILIDWWYLHNEIIVPIEQEEKKVKELQAEYTKPIYDGMIPDITNTSVKVVFSDGTEEEISGEFTNDYKEIKTRYGTVNIEIPYIQVKDLQAEYEQPVLDGDEFVKEKLTVKKIYEDGKEELVNDFIVDAPPVFTEEAQIYVSASKFRKEINIVPVKVLSAHIISSSHKAGEWPGITGINLVYENGMSVDVDKSELEFVSPMNKLQSGNNEYTIAYRGKEYNFNIEAKTTTLVEDAKKYFADEASVADYTHISDNIFVTVTKCKLGDAFYFLSHIVINDPSQLKSGLSNEAYGGSREKPTDAAKRLNWVIGINGSNFNWGTGRPEYAGVCIKNRQVMEGTKTNGMEICLMSNGVLFSPDPGVDPQALIESDVKDSWSCGDTLLLQDGMAANVGIQSNQFRYPRTAIGMVQPCEYYIITAGSGNYEGGMSYDEVRNVFMQHGCSFGKCMDGGGSSSLVLDGELLNTPAVNDSERAVADFLYFTE